MKDKQNYPGYNISLFYDKWQNITKIINGNLKQYPKYNKWQNITKCFLAFLKL